MSLDIIIQFVERKMPVDQFVENLYHNEELERLLSEDIPLSSYIGGSLYLYLLSQNFNSPGGLLDSLSALEEFLEKKQVKFERNKEALAFYSLMLKVQPGWIDIPDWYMEKLLKISEGRRGKELEKFLKDQVKQDFRYITNPPNWLQSPQWVYEKEKPLLFIDQVDITKIRHDTARLYIFLDETNQKFSLVEQTV